MTVTEVLRSFLDEHRIDGPVVVAVSGGIDSTALLIAFVEAMAIDFEAAHVNHHLRGAESDADESFVRALCERVGVQLHVFDGTLDPDEVRRSGIESAARKVRYASLRRLGRVIATAHQKNDQAETVLMRMINGGGIAALRGIHPVREDGVIRPLLGVTRGEIEAFLAERNIAPRTDTTNADPRFLRNRVRPFLAQIGPAAIDNLASVAEQARQQWRVLERVIDGADTGVATADATTFAALPDDPWLRRALLHRHIRRLDPDARDVSAADLERLANETGSRVSVTANLELIRKGREITLRRRPRETAPFEYPLSAGESVETPIGRLVVRSRAEARAPHGARQLFELPKGATPLFTVRNRRDGDRFQPLGMSKPKKLKDFLINRKIAAEFRDRVPLLVWEGRIVWIAGIEISEQFKITEEGDGDRYEASIDQKDQEGLQPESHRGAGR